MRCRGAGRLWWKKPVAATLAEADRMIAAADTAGLPLFTGHHRRCHPFVAIARDRLAQMGGSGRGAGHLGAAQA
ncbi:hypothetical protein ACFOHS_21620 [Jhaorihella thermophila]